ncbi:TraA family conjugative transfer protein [Sutterella sp.]|uniref:TraA family conjugative transfer protein n=1 Tax=Sutterella sp. TaxID=1981025 RepID=UPI003FD6F8D8
MNTTFTLPSLREIEQSEKAQSAMRVLGFLLLIAAVYFLASGECFAADQVTNDFDGIWKRLQDWTQGSLGKSISLLFLLIGLAAGLLRGSIVSCVVCLGAALALATVPSIINSIFTGTI